MRKVLILISACAIMAVALTVFAQVKDLQPLMKEIAPTNTALTNGLKNRSMAREDVVKEAEKLQKLFTDVSAFMKDKNIPDAVTMANDAANAAAELAKQAKLNESEPMFAASKVITKQCATCHAAHREQDPTTKAFKLKQKN